LGFVLLRGAGRSEARLVFEEAQRAEPASAAVAEEPLPENAPAEEASSLPQAAEQPSEETRVVAKRLPPASVGVPMEGGSPSFRRDDRSEE
jgi:hypothetical protein